MSVPTDIADAIEYEELRQHLKDIRKVGPGSRGGKGSRKARNGGKPLTRNYSAKEREAQEERISKLAEQLKPEFENVNRAKVKSFLAKKCETPGASEHWPPTFWTRILRSPFRQKVRKANRSYIAAIGMAMAVLELVATSEHDALRMHIALISEHSREPLTRKFDIVHAVLRLTIDYEDEGTGKDTRRPVSRDALAVRYLIRKGVRSYELVAWQEKHGGGVDSWSRRQAKRSSENEQDATKLPPESPRRRRYSGKHPLDKDYLDDDPEEPASENASENPNAGAADPDGDADKPGAVTWNNVKVRPAPREPSAPSTLEPSWSPQKFLGLSHALEPGFGLLALVVGDPNAKSGVRVVTRTRLGRLKSSPTDRVEIMKEIAQYAKRALNPPGSEQT